MKYVHLTGQEDLGYSLEEEILEFNGRKILYLLSQIKDDFFVYGGDIDMVFDRLRVPRKDTKTVFVKGYVVKWKYTKDEKGTEVSELEPVDSKDQVDISHLLESQCEAKVVSFALMS